MDMRLGEPQSWSGHGVEEKNSNPPAGIQTPIIQSSSQIYRLSYPGCNIIGVQTEDDEVGRTSRTHGRYDKGTQNLSDIPQGKRRLAELGVDGRKILKCLTNIEQVGVDWINLVYDRDLWRTSVNKVMNLWVL
jgi:hypothetical protein